MNNLEDVISQLNNLDINSDILDDLINLFNDIKINNININNQDLINLFNLLNSKSKCYDYNFIKLNNNLII